MFREKAVYFGWEDSIVSQEVEIILADYFELCFVRHCTFNDSVNHEEISKLKAPFLFNFGPLIISKMLLDATQIAAINFHTAPPKWPGRGSCSFALLNNDQDFGVTAHLMTEKIDAGPILQVIKFPILVDDDAQTLHERALNTIPELVRTVIEKLKSCDWQPSPTGDKWEGKARKQKELIPLMKIEPEDNDEQIRRKIRAFAHSKKPGPYMEKEGLKFWYIKSLT